MPAEDVLVKRVMPHSIEAEQSVIGSMLYSQDAIGTASEMLKKEDFYQHQYDKYRHCQHSHYRKPIRKIHRSSPLPDHILSHRLCEPLSYLP